MAFSMRGSELCPPGLRAVKLKVEREGSEKTARLARRVFGSRVDLRADANMAWDVDEAAVAMAAMARHGIRSFEQPLAADDLEGLARLVPPVWIQRVAGVLFLGFGAYTLWQSMRA